MSGDALLSIKELADALGRSRSYIFEMKRCGFIMPGNRATLHQAMSFLARNPNPWSNRTKPDTRQIAIVSLKCATGISGNNLGV